MTYTKDNTAKLQTIIAEGKAIVESLEASKRELQRRARERAVQIRRYQIAEELSHDSLSPIRAKQTEAK